MKISECGFVYMITNPNNRIYVGSTNDIEERFRYYRYLKSKKQLKLHRSFLKYGVNNHTFEIVWAGPIKEMLKCETLIGWGFNVLDRDLGLNCKLPKLGDKIKSYNEETLEKIRIGSIGNTNKKGKKLSIESKIRIGLSVRGRKQSKETIEKRSSKIRGRKYSQERIDKIKNAQKIPIIQYDMNMNFIKDWKSSTDTAKELKLSKGAICNCCKGNNFSCGKFKWKYKTTGRK